MPPQSIAPPQPPSGPPPSDDFLYHLHRGSALLLQDQMAQAKEEFEKALALQPQDAKSQDLLAGVYFRLGFYPRAIELWQKLAHAFPREASLRINLALALFKTGQAEQALSELHIVLRQHPDHDRAWNYVGLAEWRRGKLALARDAFLRGGRASMARRMEEELARTGEKLPPSRPSLPPAVGARGPSIVTEQTRVSVTPSWRVASGLPRFQEALPVNGAAPRSLRTLARQWAIPRGTALGVTERGEVYIDCSDSEVYARIDSPLVVMGELRTALVNRKLAGRDAEEVFGGSSPLLRCKAPVRLLTSAVPDATAIELADEPFFVREDLLLAFEGRVRFESARLHFRAEPVVLTQLQGPGTVVVRLADPVAVELPEDADMHVDPSRVLGWLGRIFPTARRGTAPYGVYAPPLTFRGNGLVLLTASH